MVQAGQDGDAGAQEIGDVPDIPASMNGWALGVTTKPGAEVCPDITAAVVLGVDAADRSSDRTDRMVVSFS